MDESLFVSGRLCLFGEHSDWASEYCLHEGHCITVGTQQGLHGTVEPSSDLIIRTVVPGRRQEAKSTRIKWTPDSLLAVASDKSHFFRYCAGTAYYLMRRHALPTGVRLDITRADLPIKKGLASSAAVCLLTAKAFSEVFGLELSTSELMWLAYYGERLTGSACGRLDQTCILGRRLLRLTVAGDGDVACADIVLERPIHMFFVDLGGRKNTTKILSSLRKGYRTNSRLQSAFGAENKDIVQAATEALRQGDAERVGLLMTKAQGVFDARAAVFCPSELTSPLLHALLSSRRVQKHVFGGKGVGSQGDGVAQLVARSADARTAAIREINATFPTMRSYALDIG